MTSTNTVERVRNYQGNNSFVIKMKDVISRYGKLTPKQEEAVEKCLTSETKVIDLENLSEELKTIVNYKGENTFVKDIISKFKQYGSLTDRQIYAALNQIKKEEDKLKKVQLELPTPGETIKIGRKIGEQLKEKYGLNFNPILVDITKVLSVTPKAIRFSGKMTVKRGKVCISCLKTLTDEFSMLTNMGKICAQKLGVEYITDKSQAEKFREDYLKKVEEIGEMEFWIPKSQIKKWDSATEELVNKIHE